MARSKADKPMGVAAQQSDNENVSIRKIENGFLLERSGCDKKGNYHSSTTYCASRPKIMAAPAGKGKK